jgi:hypothetical protein
MNSKEVLEKRRSIRNFMRIEQIKKESWEVSGLSCEHYNELNCVGEKGKFDINPERYNELRELYKDKPMALFSIDKFDPDSEWKNKFNQATKTSFDTRNLSAINEFEEWQKEKYPDVFE